MLIKLRESIRFYVLFLPIHLAIQLYSAAYISNNHGRIIVDVQGDLALSTLINIGTSVGTSPAGDVAGLANMHLSYIC